MESLRHRTGRSFAGAASTIGDDALDLFSRRLHSLPIASGTEAGGRNEPIRLERLSLGSAKMGRGGVDDLLDADVGKHDYDWLLTPPGTPVVPSLDISEHQPMPTAPVSSAVRSVSTLRGSRLAASHSENGTSVKPAISRSVTRPSISSTYSNYFSNNDKTSVLNTSSASVTSRPSTPGNRSTSLSTARPTTPTSSTRSRPSTPAKTRPSTSSVDRTRPLNSSRPSTPTSRSRFPASVGSNSHPKPSSEDRILPLNISRPSTPTYRSQIPANSGSTLNSSIYRSSSRPLTPTRRAPAPTPAPIAGRSSSVGRVPAENGRNPGPGPRPSSPGAKPRAPIRPIDLPEFPHDVPPNLRTKLPERPLSAGRTRPGMALTVRANSNTEPTVPPSSNRRQSLPILSKSKLPENSPKARSPSNGHDMASPENYKSLASENGIRRHPKPATTTESTGFGRTISKKSIDMALRHMDIRQSMGGIRHASLFPQSIRPSSSRGRPARASEPVIPVTSDDIIMENGNCSGTAGSDRFVSTNGADIMIMAKSPESDYLVTRNSEQDIYGSTRYEAMLLEEDSKNVNWLHSVEDKFDQSPVFDHRFEPLPEPFGLL